jgi:hypothetical protein
MLIRRNERETVLQCDGGTRGNGCMVVFYADTGDLAEARLMAEAEGWAEGLTDEHTVEDYCPTHAPRA